MIVHKLRHDKRNHKEECPDDVAITGFTHDSSNQLTNLITETALGHGRTHDQGADNHQHNAEREGIGSLFGRQNTGNNHQNRTGQGDLPARNANLALSHQSNNRENEDGIADDLANGIQRCDFLAGHRLWPWHWWW